MRLDDLDAKLGSIGKSLEGTISTKVREATLPLATQSEQLKSIEGKLAAMSTNLDALRTASTPKAAPGSASGAAPGAAVGPQPAASAKAEPKSDPKPQAKGRAQARPTPAARNEDLPVKDQEAK